MKLKELTDISPEVRKAVYERDKFGGWTCCVICGKPSRGQYRQNGVDYESGIELAHYIGRAQGGKGIEQNLASLCHDCHAMMDNGNDPDKQRVYRKMVRLYLESHYKGWNEDELKVKGKEYGKS